jgi:hypothetical protein
MWADEDGYLEKVAGSYHFMNRLTTSAVTTDNNVGLSSDVASLTST